MRTPLIAGNWKMNKTLPDARELVSSLLAGLDGVTGVDVLIFPPVQLLFPMAKAVANSPVGMGAQNAHEASHGAFTGEVSVAMLADTGCSHIIIGHSERRQLFGEKEDLLAKKVRAVVAGGLSVIYCVGETLADREAGTTDQVVAKQFSEVIGADVPAEKLVVAYEPVWAIGTGRTATPDQAQQVHASIRALLTGVYGDSAAQELCILYGGSVKPGNAAELMAQGDIDGALVGGASLVAGDFLGIISAAAEALPAAR